MATKKTAAAYGRLSYTEAMEEAIKKIGDLDEFVNAEDIIVLKLDAALPARCRIPPPLAVDVDRMRLTTNCEGFAGCQRFLSKYPYPSVLLAGLPKLGSVPSFLDAAREVLCGTQTLIIVHNRDRILDLVAWFRCPTVMLYHDLQLQPDHGGLPSPDIDRFPHLRVLYGTTPALGCDQLFLSADNIVALIENAHKLAILQAPMRDVVLSARSTDTPYEELASYVPLFSHCEEITLGFHMWSRGGTAKTVGVPASVGVINDALKLCPHLRRLQVTTDSKEGLGRIAKFSRLVRLSIMYVGEDHPYPFDPDMTNLLRALSSLTHLTLSYFKEVSLSTIDKTCRNLQSLTLTGSKVLEESVDPNAFPKLKSLSLDWLIKAQSFGTLLCAARSLTDLCLEGGRVCAEFLTSAFCVPHKRLQRLTLGTDKPLAILCARPEDLRAVFKGLPALERLSTDSYDIQLFVQNYYPRVKLTWTSCTTCAAEFPKVNAAQEKMWREVHADA